MEASLSMGETETYLKYFDRYMVLNEKVLSRKDAIEKSTGKVGLLFYRDQTFHLAIKTAAVIAQRYPSDDSKSLVLKFEGEQYQRSLDRVKARERFETLLADYPESIYRKAVYKRLGAMLPNMNKVDDAIKLYESFAKEFTSDDDKAFSLFRIGWCYFGKGEGSFPSAKMRFKELTLKYPKSRYAQTARALIHEMEKKQKKN